MSNSAELLDLDRLEALARAADPHGAGHLVTHYRLSANLKAEEAWRKAANPAAVLTLIALTRRAQPEGEAPFGKCVTQEMIRAAEKASLETGALFADEIPMRQVLEAAFSLQTKAVKAAPSGWVGIAMINGEQTSVAFRDEETAHSVSLEAPFPFWTSATKCKPEGEAPQAEPVAYLHQVVCGDGEADQALSFAPDNFPLAGTLGYRSLSHQPLYTAPAAQHAESSAPAGTGRQLMDQWTGAAKALEERATQAAAVKPWQQRVAESGKRECADLAVDCLMAEVAELRVLLKRPMLDEDAYLAAQSQGAPSYQVFSHDSGEWYAVDKAQYERAHDSCRRIAAQQAAAPGALDADEMTRLRRLIHALGMDGSTNASDDQVRGLLFTTLGQAAGKLERATGAPGTPEAPAAWMDPNAGCVMDAFLWQKDPSNPQYSVPVYTRAAQLDGGQGEGK